jgi:hypothetical protein
LIFLVEQNVERALEVSANACMLMSGRIASDGREVLHRDMSCSLLHSPSQTIFFINRSPEIDSFNEDDLIVPQDLVKGPDFTHPYAVCILLALDFGNVEQFYWNRVIFQQKERFSQPFPLMFT